MSLHSGSPRTNPNRSCSRQTAACQPSLLTQDTLPCQQQHRPQATLTRSLSGQAPAPEQTDRHTPGCFPHAAASPPTEELKQANSFLQTELPLCMEHWATEGSKSHPAPWAVAWDQLPPRRGGNTGQTQPHCIPRGHDTSQLYSKGASLSKLNVSPNQMGRAKHSEMVLIIQRLQNKAARPVAFSFQQSKFGIHLTSSSPI